MSRKTKYIIDPVLGFTPIDDELILFLVKHPYFQRLTRIRQLGVEGIVYPGAQHTRFQHSLGAYHLTRQALDSLEAKGVEIDPRERRGVLAAILLHDIGHGPFSHVLENVIVPDIDHEGISRMVMERIDAETDGKLTDAIAIFTDTYHKHYLHELISSQLDMDRLDYLCRDSFFTGVREGNVGAARIIQMLNVRDDHVTVDEKGVYSLENYLMTRRMMYWQVYYHKTAIAAEVVLTGALRRARQLFRSGADLFASPALTFFLKRDVGAREFDGSDICLDNYINLDDNDIISALKVWRNSNDKILATLSSHFIDRRIFKTDIYDGDAPDCAEQEMREKIMCKLGITAEETDFFVCKKIIEKDMYNRHADQIRISLRNGTVCTMPEVSEIIRNDTGSSAYRKTYLVHERI